MHANNCYTLSCRQHKTEFLELNYDKIQKTLRVASFSLSFVVVQQDNSAESFPHLVSINEAIPLLLIAYKLAISR